jgi:hypothetical protein
MVAIRHVTLRNSTTPSSDDITLTYNRMELAADPGQSLTIWTAEPETKSAEALSLLGSWAATPRQPNLRDLPKERRID